MSLSLKFSLLSLLITSPVLANSWLKTLDLVEEKFEEIYCFKNLKGELFRWDAHREMNRVRQEISSQGQNPTPSVARNFLGTFHEATRDVHVRARFLTSSPYSMTRLPFNVRSTGDGHYYIVGVERDFLPEDQFPFELGDELLSVSGKSTQSWVNEYLPFFYAQVKTQQAQAERNAFAHYDAMGKSMPTGEAIFKIKRAKTRATETYSTNWITTLKSSKAAKNADQEMRRVWGKGADSFLPVEKTVVALNPVENYGKTGARTPFFPALGKIVWESNEVDPFHAYIFELPSGKLAGFVRIPTYYPRDMIHVSIPGFFALMERFVEANISVLIYDQTNNSGGSLLYTYDLLSALIEKPIKPTLKVEWIAHETHWELGQKWSDLREVAIRAKTDPAAFERFQNEIFTDKLVDTEFLDAFIYQADHVLNHLARSDHSRLVPAIPFEGVKVIRPKSGKRYTGPILMLVNELSISAADLSPALFQDLGRAVIFGSKTAGAGAYQNGYEAPENNPYELYYSSISFGKFTRASGLPVENYAVVPTIPYEVTTEDLRGEMSGYRGAVVKAALSLIP